MVERGAYFYTRGPLPTALLPVTVSGCRHADLKTRGPIPRQKLSLVKKLYVLAGLGLGFKRVSEVSG